MKMTSFYMFCVLLLSQLHVGLAFADTTNRAQQFSPVPGVFVGGVGLLCDNTDLSTSAKDRLFLLLTRDRSRGGVASFEAMDVDYIDFDIVPSLSSYSLENDELSATIDRQDLTLALQDSSAPDIVYSFSCSIQTVDGLHDEAKKYLRALLSKNKI